ncbi:MAG: hypothetical protein M1831_001916 [Alyxoria varia]|nr:MAG: hypothetical protein M1831_001916 [Alyxoria varia]
MSEQLDRMRDALDGQIDFNGQRLADQLNTNTLAVIGLVAFLAGYFTQNLQHTLWIGVGGTAVVFLVIVPPWPMYNRKPATWLPARGNLSGINISMDGQKDE